MGQALSTIDKCFQPAHLVAQDDASSLPASKKSSTTSKPTETKPPATKPTSTSTTSTPAVSKPEPKVEKKIEPKVEDKPIEQSSTPSPTTAPATSTDDLPPYTNRPEDLSAYPAATGTFKPKKWEEGVAPVLSAPLTGEIVTDGKVQFDKAALSYDGVFPSRTEEVAYLEKAIALKKDAAAATATANGLHEEHNKLYEAGDKEGAQAKLAESKTYRQKAQDIHQESFDMAYAGAMSMAIKACYSKYPSIDYHVFLMDPYEKSYLVAIDMMKKQGKYGRKDFMVIPGEGQHSEKGKGPLIRPHFEKWMADNNIKNEQITSGSYAITL